MDGLQKIRLCERLLFGVLLVAIGMAGYFYETFKEAVNAYLLLPLIIGYLLGCYIGYRGLLWFVVRHFAQHEPEEAE